MNSVRKCYEYIVIIVIIWIGYDVIYWCVLPYMVTAKVISKTATIYLISFVASFKLNKKK